MTNLPSKSFIMSCSKLKCINHCIPIKKRIFFVFNWNHDDDDEEHICQWLKWEKKFFDLNLLKHNHQHRKCVFTNVRGHTKKWDMPYLATILSLLYAIYQPQAWKIFILINEIFMTKKYFLFHPSSTQQFFLLLFLAIEGDWERNIYVNRQKA